MTHIVDNNYTNGNGTIEQQQKAHERLGKAIEAGLCEIGDTAAEKIEKAADEFMADATQIARNLRDLADAFRGHAKVAHQQVTIFREKSDHVMETMRGLQEKLALQTAAATNGHAQEAAAQVDDIATRMREIAEEKPNG